MERNPAAATRLKATISEITEDLAVSLGGRYGRVDGTYEIVLQKFRYIVVYRVEKVSDVLESAVILRIIHTSRDWRVDQWPRD